MDLFDYAMNFERIVPYITGFVAIYTIYVIFLQTRKDITLERGQTKVYKGLTLRFKHEEGYKLSIICLKGVEGENVVYDVVNETVSYEYLYKDKNHVLTVNINSDKLIITI